MTSLVNTTRPSNKKNTIAQIKAILKENDAELMDLLRVAISVGEEKAKNRKLTALLNGEQTIELNSKSVLDFGKQLSQKYKMIEKIIRQPKSTSPTRNSIIYVKEDMYEFLKKADLGDYWEPVENKETGEVEWVNKGKLQNSLYFLSQGNPYIMSGGLTSLLCSRANYLGLQIDEKRSLLYLDPKFAESFKNNIVDLLPTDKEKNKEFTPDIQKLYSDGFIVFPYSKFQKLKSYHSLTKSVIVDRLPEPMRSSFKKLASSKKDENEKETIRESLRDMSSELTTEDQKTAFNMLMLIESKEIREMAEHDANVAATLRDYYRHMKKQGGKTTTITEIRKKGQKVRLTQKS